jgi:GDPmannose 4,6-dehydratase
MWLMLQQPTPKDYILATGKTHSVREFLELAFQHVGLNWQEYYRHDPRFQRPVEPENLRGDASRAMVELGWKPKISLAQLAAMMVDHDLHRLKHSMRQE